MFVWLQACASLSDERGSQESFRGSAQNSRGGRLKMTEINQQPMSESIEEQKKKRLICEICKEDRSYQDWSDAIITFTNPAEHYHLGCLQLRVRELTSRKLTYENVQRALDKAIRSVIRAVPDVVSGKIVYDIQMGVLVDELNAELKAGQ
jgi:hypothetical protein